MQARKMVLETDRYGKLLHQPELPPNICAEVIFLIPETEGKEKKRRSPSPRIAGKGSILGDIISPAVPPEDWEAM